MSEWTIRAATPLEIEWFCRERVGYTPCVDITGIVSVTAGNYIGAMVAYDHWVPNSCEMHVWVGHAAAVSRRFIRECINYPFAHGRKVIIGRTPAWNYDALDFNERIGFREIERIDGAYGRAPGDSHVSPIDPDHEYALVIQELRHEDALKWFPPSIIDNHYGGVQWLQTAHKARLSTKTQQLSQSETSGLSFKPWSKPTVPYPKITKESLEKAWKEMEMLMKTKELELDKMMLEGESKFRKSIGDELYGSAGETSSNIIDWPLSSPKISF